MTLSHRWLISFCFKVCGVFTKDGLSLQVYVNAIVIHVLCVSVAPHRNFLYSCKAIVCSSIVYSEVNITITTFSTYCRTVFLNFFFSFSLPLGCYLFLFQPVCWFLSQSYCRHVSSQFLEFLHVTSFHGVILHWAASFYLVFYQWSDLHACGLNPA